RLGARREVGDDARGGVAALLPVDEDLGPRDGLSILRREVDLELPRARPEEEGRETSHRDERETAEDDARLARAVARAGTRLLDPAHRRGRRRRRRDGRLRLGGGRRRNRSLGGRRWRNARRGRRRRDARLCGLTRGSDEGGGAATDLC